MPLPPPGVHLHQQPKLEVASRVGLIQLYAEFYVDAVSSVDELHTGSQAPT